MRALDIDCPKGHAAAGVFCAPLSKFCQARLNAAAATTREANRALREQQPRAPSTAKPKRMSEAMQQALSMLARSHCHTASTTYGNSTISGVIAKRLVELGLATYIDGYQVGRPGKLTRVQITDKGREHLPIAEKWPSAENSSIPTVRSGPGRRLLGDDDEISPATAGRQNSSPPSVRSGDGSPSCRSKGR